MIPSSSSVLRPLAALAAAGALALAGCGGDDDEPTARTFPGATVTATGSGVVGADGTTTAPSPGTTAGGAAEGSRSSDGGSATEGSGGGGSATGGSAGGGDEAAYVRRLESICKTVAKDSQAFVAEVSKAGASQSIEPIKEPMKRFFDAVGRSYQQLAAAQAPDKWASYQASLRSDAAGVSKYLDEAKDLLDDARSSADLQKLQALMGRTNFNTGDAPKDLAARTPSCNSGAAADARTVTTPAP